MAERILVIDDEPNIRQMIRLALESAAYEVEEAEDGIEAFAILGADQDFDVVLLDQRMPLMDGTDVLRRIKVMAPSTRVVMMTAFASVEIAVEAMKLGAADFLRKPMTPEIVRNAVSAAISARKLNNEEGSEERVTRNVTMNGFAILRGSDVARVLPQRPNERRFLVRKPDGTEQDVLVEISENAFRQAQEAAKGRHIEKAFWTSQAETFLSAFIWNDGNVPTSGRLVLKGIDTEGLRSLLKNENSNE